MRRSPVAVIAVVAVSVLKTMTVILSVPLIVKMTEGRKREREIERYEISVFIKF